MSVLRKSLNLLIVIDFSGLTSECIYYSGVFELGGWLVSGGEMDFTDFERVTLKFWRDYMSGISDAKKAGKLCSGEGGILFPNILMVTNCEGYYVAELLGAGFEYVGLSLKKSRTQSISKYFNQFDDSAETPLFVLDGSDIRLEWLCLSHAGDFEEVKKRFPAFGNISTRLIRTSEAETSGSVVAFSDAFRSASFHNCLIVNQRGSAYRCKSILALMVVSSSVKAGELKEFYSRQQKGDEVSAVHTVSAGGESVVAAGQFQNLYLSQGVHETTLGEFLRLHPDFLKKSFSCDEFLYEKSFQWKESKFFRDEQSINPDLLIKRLDGFYDICDLKTAAFKYKSLTNSKTSRKKFNDYIYDGIAQLNTYREYFTYEENARHAFEVHGVKVSNPKLILIVGSWENACLVDIEQACLNHPEITIIDYDTFCHLYIAAAHDSARLT